MLVILVKKALNLSGKMIMENAEEAEEVEEYTDDVPDGVHIIHAEAIWILGTFRTSIIVNN